MRPDLVIFARTELGNRSGAVLQPPHLPAAMTSTWSAAAEQALTAAFRISPQLDAARCAELAAQSGTTPDTVRAWFQGRQSALQEAAQTPVRPVGSMGHAGDGKITKRINLTQKQISVLVSAFEREPHPDVEQRLKLSMHLGMSARCVQVWFQNRRQRSKFKSDSQAEHSRSSQWQLTPWQFHGHRPPPVPPQPPTPPARAPPSPAPPSPAPPSPAPPEPAPQQIWERPRAQPAHGNYAGPPPPYAAAWPPTPPTAAAIPVAPFRERGSIASPLAKAEQAKSTWKPMHVIGPSGARRPVGPFPGAASRPPQMRPIAPTDAPSHAPAPAPTRVSALAPASVPALVAAAALRVQATKVGEATAAAVGEAAAAAAVAVPVKTPLVIARPPPPKPAPPAAKPEPPPATSEAPGDGLALLLACAVPSTVKA